MGTRPYPEPVQIVNTEDVPHPRTPTIEISEPKDTLIGSLREFTALKTLSIEAVDLCGHQTWYSPLVKTLDILPPNLEYLKIYCATSRVREERSFEYENHLLAPHLLDLVKRGRAKLPSLWRLRVVISAVDAVDLDRADYKKALDEVRKGADNTGLDFTFEYSLKGRQTTISFFKGQKKYRKPGQDY
ncbi:hypothetical protein G7Y89_g6529 [Cudoniella acicularis]|uniref:Uncharacterized protein n=1 Tax=Cudoniella acicularis TaxID=354080 RepID=A0A8H4RM29_9HELO|nr:hypothetical protein G7Y89_g6529 [Cudoniella acicularis]